MKPSGMRKKKKKTDSWSPDRRAAEPSGRENSSPPQLYLQIVNKDQGLKSYKQRERGHLPLASLILLPRRPTDILHLILVAASHPSP